METLQGQQRAVSLLLWGFSVGTAEILQASHWQRQSVCVSKFAHVKAMSKSPASPSLRLSGWEL